MMMIRPRPLGVERLDRTSVAHLPDSDILMTHLIHLFRIPRIHYPLGIARRVLQTGLRMGTERGCRAKQMTAKLEAGRSS